jgi:hypothetical protein
MGAQENKPYVKELEISPHTEWSQAFWDQFVECREKLTHL